MTLVEVIVALALASLTVVGVVTGYIYCSNAAVKDSLYAAANGRMIERLEDTRSARWDTSSFPVVDQLVATNFPDKIVPLDQSGSITNKITTGILKTEIATISTSPPLKRVRIYCIWRQITGEQVTNTIETFRAPDQ